MDGEVRELLDALADAAPVRDPDGGVPATDAVAVERAARALKRCRKRGRVRQPFASEQLR